MESSPLEFARPFWLYAGPVVCALLAWLMWIFARKREADLAKLVHPRFRQRLLPGLSPRLVLVKRSLWLLAVLLLFTAIAGPRKGYEWREVKRRGIDLLFAVDTSKSMLAEDLAPNRLERARMGIHDFIERLKGDRVGLIPFAGSSYALCPLTLDYDAFRESLDALDTDLIPRQGTDVASAIREADRLFAEKGTSHRILVLITDGEDLQGDALDAAAEAKKNGMTIYPVGVGSTEGTTIPLRLANGQKDLVRDDAGNPVTTKLDEGMLKKIAGTTGGLYATLGRGAEGLDLIYREKLRLMPQIEMDSKMEKLPLERFEWPLAAALLLLLVEFLLPDRLRPAKVRALPSAARRHASPATTTALLAAALLLSVSENSPAAEDPRAIYNEGTAAFSAGDFAKAEERLRASLNTPDLKLQNRAYYNLGNTLYRVGQAAESKAPEETIKSWENALKAYSDALALDATDSDARFNHEFVQRKLDELKKQQEKKNEQKQDPKDDKKDQEKKEEEKNGQENKDQQKNGQDQQKQDEKKSGEDSKDEQGKDGEKSEGKQNSEQHGGDQKQDGPDSEKKQGGQQSDEKKSDEPTGKTKPEESGAEKKEGPEQQAGKDGEKKDEAQANAEKQTEAKPGEEKKEGEATETGKETKDQKGEESGVSEERRTPGEMTKMEARQLLQALKGDQRTVIPLERPDPRRRFRDPANTIKGKTW